jgi:thiamine pyrophosphate-dependent acetolactate synthase large subunit-like protein
VVSIGDGVTAAEVELCGADAPPGDVGYDLDPESIVAAVDLLEASQRPLIVAGHGAVHADVRAELERLAALIGARLTNSLYGCQFFSGHPHYLGLCGTWSPSLAQRAFEASDVVVAAGASLNRYTTARGTIFGSAKIIHCEVDPDQPLAASAPELALVGDLATTIPALIDEWQRRGLAPRSVAGESPSIEAIKASVMAVDLGHDPERGLDLRDVYFEIDRKLPDDRIIVTDSGRHLACLPSLVGARDARSFIMSRGYGSVGMGLGAAIGAAAAHPQRPVVLLCGDGGFTMAAQELDTIRRHRMNITIVVINDEMYGAEVRYLRGFGLPTDVLNLDLGDVAAIASAHGGSGVVVRTRDELLDLELPSSGLFIVDARIDPELDGRAAVG